MKFVLSKINVPYLFLGISLMVYGIFGKTAPRIYNFPEYIIGYSFIIVLLILLFQKSFWSRDYFSWFFIISLLYFLLVPVFISFHNGWTIRDFSRDFVAVIFMFLFIFIYPLAKDNPFRCLNIISSFLAFIGLAFSIRYLLNINFVDLFNKFTIKGPEVYYYTRDPAVIFSLIYFFHQSINFFNNKKILYSIFFLFLSSVVLLALSITGTRLGIFLFLVTGIFTIFMYFYFFPKKALWFFLIILIFTVPMSGEIVDILLSLYNKHITFGLNNRDLEFFASIDQINSFEDFLFGNGWGSLFTNPLFENPQRFVHNYSLFFFIKSGFFGFLISTILMFFCIFVVLKSLVKNFLKKDIFSHNTTYPIAIAAISCLFENFFFTASFKSLTFGLVVLLAYCLYLKMKIRKN